MASELEQESLGTLEECVVAVELTQKQEPKYANDVRELLIRSRKFLV